MRREDKAQPDLMGPPHLDRSWCSSASPALYQLAPRPCWHIHALGFLCPLLGWGLEYHSKELWLGKWRKT